MLPSQVYIESPSHFGPVSSKFSQNFSFVRENGTYGEKRMIC